MKVGIDFIKSIGIRNEILCGGYSGAELLGTFNHPGMTGEDWHVRIYRVSSRLVFETSGDPIWEGTEAFKDMLAEYRIDLDELISGNE